MQSTPRPAEQGIRPRPELSISYIGFNTQKAPFDDPKVRQAFAQAIDREQITKVVFKDMLPPANSFMMPGLPGYNARTT